jgi:hypothetical protein
MHGYYILSWMSIVRYQGHFVCAEYKASVSPRKWSRSMVGGEKGSYLLKFQVLSINSIIKSNYFIHRLIYLYMLDIVRPSPMLCRFKTKCERVNFVDFTGVAELVLGHMQWNKASFYWNCSVVLACICYHPLKGCALASRFGTRRRGLLANYKR